ncbi:MAG TPA: hypothetical protein VG458_09615, partial [Solirubrobacterales bacterium]|nr:hypothetical protein [Solirubrobacterales bacterium]
TEEEPGGDVLLAGAALGRSVALRELPKGELIGKGDVVTGLEEVPGPVRLELRPERASALGIEAGESVELRLSPTGRAGEPIVVTGVLLAIPDAEDGAEQTYVVAFTRPAAKRLMGSLGRAVLLLSAG